MPIDARLINRLQTGCAGGLCKQDAQEDEERRIDDGCDAFHGGEWDDEDSWTDGY